MLGNFLLMLLPKGLFFSINVGCKFFRLQFYRIGALFVGFYNIQDMPKLL